MFLISFFFTLTSDVHHKRTDVLFRLYPDIKECYDRYLELVQILGMSDCHELLVFI